MADSSQALPIARNVSLDILENCRTWHHHQVTFLDHNKGPNRDEKSILRSERTIKAINEVLRDG